MGKSFQTDKVEQDTAGQETFHAIAPMYYREALGLE